MQDFNFQLLQSLLFAYGPSGQEDEVRTICEKEIKHLVDTVWTDPAGNLIGKIKGKNNKAPAIRLMVHMDEIAMIVKRVNEDGSLRVNPLGGSYPASFGQGIVDVLGDNENISAILSFGSMHTTKESHHTNKIMPKEFKGEGLAPFWDNIHITTRKSLQELSKAGVFPGTRVVVSKSRRNLHYIQDCIASYFLDNRASIAILIETLKEIKKKNKQLENDIYFVATCSEEVGAYGASYASRALPGDITIAVDVGPVSLEYQTKLNEYPIIVYQDTAAIYDKKICDYLVKLSEKLNFSPQRAVFETYGSDASIAKNNGQSAKAALICFPVENTHGYEIAHKDSLKNTVKLLSAYLANPLI